MRITEGMIHNNLLNSLQSGQARLEQIQQQSSSGLRINAPGDDPVAAQQVLQLKGILQDGLQYARNITIGNAWLVQSDSAMDDMGNAVTRAREIAQQMANGTNDAKVRADAANELKQLKSQLVQLGNTQVAGKYIFGGFSNDKPPFDTTPISNPPLPGPPSVPDPLNGTPVGTFVGTDDAVTMEVDRGTYLAYNYSGEKLLRGGSPAGSSGVDIVGELDKLTTALATNDLSGIQNSLSSLDAAQKQITSARADVGARINRLEHASSNIESMKVSTNKLISDKQDADFLKVMSDLSSQQTAFQASLAASGKISQLSLLDYLK